MVFDMRGLAPAEAHSFLTARLYGQMTVRVCAYGGSFTQNGHARHPEVLRFFYEKLNSFAEPNIVDAGASTGSFVLLAAFHTSASVLAFEPLQDRATELRRNIALNQLERRVHVIQTALWEARGARNLYHHPCGPSLVRQTDERTRVATRRLDEMLEPTDRVDLIRLSVNGGELQVLRGAEETLRRWKPDLLLRGASRAVRGLLSEYGITVEPAVGSWTWARWN